MRLPTSKGAVPWLNERVIFLTLAGSRAYGTSLPTSDTDIRGVAIALREHYLGFVQQFEQAIFKDPDVVVYDLLKFMKLASDANPSVLEVLFTDPRDYLVMTPLGEKLIASRHLFLSKKARYSFVGYAMSQLKRIETHRRWLLHPPKGQPLRSDFGLPEQVSLPKDRMGAVEALVRGKLDAWGVDWEVLEPADRIAFREKFEQTLTEMAVGTEVEQFASAARVLGIDDNFLDIIQREKGYQAAKQNWRQYQEWQSNRNPDRAQMEEQFGYDCKHAMHLVRLCRMGREVLERGEVIVKRPDAEELLAIRGGSWSYDQLIAWAKEQEEIMAKLYETSTAVPMQPNRKALEALCVELVEDALAGKGLQRTFEAEC